MYYNFWCLVLGAWCLVLGAWWLMVGACCLVASVRRQVGVHQDSKSESMTILNMASLDITPIDMPPKDMPPMDKYLSSVLKQR